MNLSVNTSLIKYLTPHPLRFPSYLPLPTLPIIQNPFPFPPPPFMSNYPSPSNPLSKLTPSPCKGFSTEYRE